MMLSVPLLKKNTEAAIKFLVTLGKKQTTLTATKHGVRPKFDLASKKAPLREYLL
jgi:hypothetical protein